MGRGHVQTGTGCVECRVGWFWLVQHGAGSARQNRTLTSSAVNSVQTRGTNRGGVPK